MFSQRKRLGIDTWLPILTVLMLIFAGQVYAQIATTAVRGTVKDDKGVLPGAKVVAVDTETGFQYSAFTAQDGSFALPGLRPGTYEITVSIEGFHPQTLTARVLVGQNLSLEFQLASDQLVAENITVVGDVLRETKNTDIATNITEQQIQMLPQNNRNFLNFANLAPGVQVSNDEFRKQVSSGGMTANATNVFIDGASYKNDVLEGGVVGQDSSRGNPFPQNAVQEFKVVTQNFKAEYEKSSSSIITAVTKSGGNTWSGNAFLLYQDDALTAQDVFSKERGQDKPDLTQYQTGVSIGGPIVKDKFHVFAAFEDNRQDRTNTVTPGLPIDVLNQFAGTFVSPFRSRLFFTKASYQPAQDQTLDFSYHLRDENDIRGFGGTTSFEAAEDVAVNNNTFLARHQLVRSSWFNEISFTAQRSEWNPRPLNPGQVGREFPGVIRIGGRDTEQDFTQDRFSFRDDFSFMKDWHGQHSFKTGGVVSFLNYDVQKRLFGNPLFTYNIGAAFPGEARYGVGNPDLSTKNHQFGVYFQDDWTASPRLTFNLGLRWDYESDELNNNYVTPADVRAALTGLVDPIYFTDGNDRPSYTKAFQPRVGVSYDLSGDSRTVLFAGYGRYYDRVVYNHTLDERFRLQWGVRLFRFSADGLPRDGFPTIQWNDSYLSKAGLDQLIALGVAPNPEVFLIANNTEPPHSDQWDIGIRHAFGDVLLSASYAGIRGSHFLTFLFGNRRPDGSCCQPVPGNFSNILISSDAKKTWYDALYLTVEKPLTGGSHWGGTLSYTFANAEQIGGDLFSLDRKTVEEYPRYQQTTNQKHRLVVSGIYQFGYDITLSGLLTWASGYPYTIADATRGFGPNEFVIRFGEGTGDPYQSLDLRVDKGFRIAGHHVISAIFEVFNIFNHENFADYNSFIPPSPEVNPNFGKPTRQYDQRRAQFGIDYTF